MVCASPRSSNWTTFSRVVKAAGLEVLAAMTLGVSSLEHTMVARPACETMNASASAPRVSYRGTLAAFCVHSACCTVVHSHRFLA